MACQPVRQLGSDRCACVLLGMLYWAGVDRGRNMSITSHEQCARATVDRAQPTPTGHYTSPTQWLTPMSGLRQASASVRATTAPQLSGAPMPGPCPLRPIGTTAHTFVKQMQSTSAGRMRASRSACTTSPTTLDLSNVSRSALLNVRRTDGGLLCRAARSQTLRGEQMLLEHWRALGHPARSQPQFCWRCLQFQARRPFWVN